MKGALIILLCATTLILGEARISNKKIEDEEPESPIINDDPSLAPVICAAADSNGILVAHEDCSKFYVCNNGRQVAMPCPPNLLYNPLKEQCDWAENVKCPARIPGIEIDVQGNDKKIPGAVITKDDDTADDAVVNDDYNLAPAICAAEGSEGVLVANKYCNHFYKCNNGRPVALRCPSELLYNPKNEQCDWAYNVQCGTRVIPEPEVDNDEDDADDKLINDDYNLAPEVCARKGSDGVLVAHRYCNHFYNCVYGVPVALRCPLNLLYNPRLQQCDWPKNVDCGTRRISDDDVVQDDGGADDDGVNDDYNLAPKICAAKGTNGVLIANRYCNHFYKCNNGFPVAIRCPLNLLYNPRTEQCDWPTNVVCGSRIIPKPEADDDKDDNIVGDDEGNDVSSAQIICAAAGSDGVLVAHRNCNQFYICTHGHPVALQCPLQFNLRYNLETEQCDWPQYVDCTGRLV